MPSTITSPTSHLLVDQSDGVLTLTLNRPERRNAMSGEMLSALYDCLFAASHDHSIGCVVMTGAGGAFCAGGDVKGMAEKKGAEGAAGPGTLEQAAGSLRRGMEASRLLHEMSKPTIASMPGAAAGAGLSLALACDLRIAVQGAKITTAFAKVGLAGDYGGSYFLSKLVGTGKARELYYFSEVLVAEQAAEMGIVNRVVAPQDLETATREWAQRLAGGPRVALASMKRNLNLAEEGRLAASLDQEALFHTRSAQTEDHAEAAKAFTEKRVPSFVGR